MKHSRIASDDPRVQAAVVELQTLIQQHDPATTFHEKLGEDPQGAYLMATVDVEDTDEVVDVYIERLLELQIDADLAICAIPIRPLDRVAL